MPILGPVSSVTGKIARSITTPPLELGFWESGSLGWGWGAASPVPNGVRGGKGWPKVKVDAVIRLSGGIDAGQAKTTGIHQGWEKPWRG